MTTYEAELVDIDENYGDFLADPHVAAVRAVSWIEHPAVGRMPVANLPGARPAGDGAPALSPAIGEHSRPVLAELGLAAAEIEALIKSGVVAEPAAVSA